VKKFSGICIRQTQQEVSDVINKYSELKDQKKRLPYGGNKGNFGTFESQQNHPVPALIERLQIQQMLFLLKIV
jgi:hypothetical protein